MTRAGVAAFFVTLLFAHGAWAQTRVVVRPFTGRSPPARASRSSSVLSDQEGIELVADADAQAAADELGADLETSDGRIAVARKLTLSAFIQGDVHKKGKNSEIELSVIEGKTGALLDKATLRAKAQALPREVRDRFMRELGSAVFQAQPPAAEPPPPPPPPVAAAPKPPRSRRRRGPPRSSKSRPPKPAAARGRMRSSSTRRSPC